MAGFLPEDGTAILKDYWKIAVTEPCVKSVQESCWCELRDGCRDGCCLGQDSKDPVSHRPAAPSQDSLCICFAT